MSSVLDSSRNYLLNEPPLALCCHLRFSTPLAPPGPFGGGGAPPPAESRFFEKSFHVFQRFFLMLEVVEIFDRPGT